MACFDVLVKDGESRCLPNGKDGIHGLDSYIRNGWSLVWTDAPSAIEGWAWALRQHEAMPVDYDDPYSPSLIKEPTILFRSVSLEEMSSILETGAVKGGGNDFNGFDTRPFTFFSPTMSASTIWQGEEIERQASRKLAEHPIVAAFDKAEKELSEFLKDIEMRARKKIEDLNVERGEKGWPLLMSTPEDWARFRKPWSYDTFHDTVGYLKGAPGIFERLGKLECAVDQVKRDYLRIHRETTDEIANETEALSYSSAVIETVPISHGFHYSQSFGKSGMGEEDEYGLFPNQVTIDDIVRVHWVKNCVVLRTTDLVGAREIMEQIDRERAALYGVEPSVA